MIYAAIALYAVAIAAANLLVATFGPAVTPINAFFLIGLDLSLRNWLALRIPAPQMLALIAASAGLSYVVNPATGTIAVASMVAFTASALADWLTFRTVPGSWLRRSIGGVTVGAAVDSLVFPTLAFGALLPGIVLAQFIAKVAGGSIWTWLINRRVAA